MQVSFIPQRRADSLSLSVSGDTLIINDEPFDLSGIPEGATLPRAAVACSWLASDIERINGVLQLTLILPHGADAPPQTLFPQPITITADGPVLLPPYSSEETPA